MIKIYLYFKDDNNLINKKVIAELGDENQLHFFKQYVKETYDNNKTNFQVTYKKPYKKEVIVLNNLY